jgi:hypothetical protein
VVPSLDIVLIGRTVQLETGRTVVTLRIAQLHLNAGRCRMALWLADPRSGGIPGVYDYVESAFELEVVAKRCEPSASTAMQRSHIVRSLNLNDARERAELPA